ncbi:hypothetical protein HF072_17165 [Bacillus sp. RO3]|nr:hypothetical protein [Bacillus sp. RO3]
MKFEKKTIQYTALSLLFLSCFLPWYETYTEEASLILDTFSFLGVVFSTFRLPLIYDFGYGIWGSITLNMHFIFGTLSIALPILISITMYRMVKKQRYSSYVKLVTILSVLTILNYINYYLFYNYAEMDTSLKSGMFLALFSLLMLHKYPVMEKYLNHLASYTFSKLKEVRSQTQNSSEKPVENSYGEDGKVNYCSDCGHKVERNSRYCASCGKKVSDRPVSGSTLHNQGGSTSNTHPLSRGLQHPVVRRTFHQMNLIIKRNPLVSLVAAVVVIVFMVKMLEVSPEQAVLNAYEDNRERAMEAAEESVEEQIKIDGFKFVDSKDMEATMTREENINLQQSGIFLVTGTAVLKDTKGKKHDDIPFQLYVDFYQGKYRAQKIVDIRYGYPLIDQLR